MFRNRQEERFHIPPEELSPSDKRNPVTFPENGGWKHHTNRRKRKPPTVGSSQSTKIKTITPPTIASVFVTRCAPETTTADMISYCEEDNQWKVLDIEKRPTRYETYASFRIKIQSENRADVYLSTNWPERLIVRRFLFHRRENSEGPGDSPQPKQ